MIPFPPQQLPWESPKLKTCDPVIIAQGLVFFKHTGDPRRPKDGDLCLLRGQNDGNGYFSYQKYLNGEYFLHNEYGGALLQNDGRQVLSIWALDGGIYTTYPSFLQALEVYKAKQITDLF